MNARSALFDLYGDHLLSRGEQAPVAALVRLLAPLRVSAPAVRTAVSRMASQGWLAPVRLPEGAGYRLTPRATTRLRQAAERIYRHATPAWDGRWHVIVVERITERPRRDRLRSALGYLGYACLDGSTWISPRQSGELEALLLAERVTVERFHASYQGDPRGLAARAWDIDGLGRAYLRWLELVAPLAEPTEATEPTEAPEAETSQDCRDEALFAARSELVHGWRKFLFIDPALPAELLPASWPGARAADFFDAQAARLLPAAARFVDRCLTSQAPCAGSAQARLRRTQASKGSEGSATPT